MTKERYIAVCTDTGEFIAKGSSQSSVTAIADAICDNVVDYQIAPVSSYSMDGGVLRHSFVRLRLTGSWPKAAILAAYIMNEDVTDAAAALLESGECGWNLQLDLQAWVISKFKRFG